jgi:hypothetical protein
MVSVLKGNEICVYADEPDCKLASYFKELYDESFDEKYTTIDSDEAAYCFLKDNLQYITFEDDGSISVTIDNAEIDKKITATEVTAIQSFVERLDALVELNAIEINKSFLLKPGKPERYPIIRKDRHVISIMKECRKHAKELKKVYDNAIFSQKHLIAGMYFAERVKSNGDWDYKSYLGTRTLYYVEDLKSNMTGEAIGNFHYGYVGRSIFSATVLKSAAGMYQLISGTSKSDYWDTYFDDPRDQAEIQRGIDKYDSEH